MTGQVPPGGGSLRCPALGAGGMSSDGSHRAGRAAGKLSGINAEITQWRGAADQDFLLSDFFRTDASVMLHVNLTSEHGAFASPAHALAARGREPEPRRHCGIKDVFVDSTGHRFAAADELHRK